MRVKLVTIVALSSLLSAGLAAAPAAAAGGAAAVAIDSPAEGVRPPGGDGGGSQLLPGDDVIPPPGEGFIGEEGPAFRPGEPQGNEEPSVATPATATYALVIWQRQERNYWCGPGTIRMGVSAMKRPFGQNLPSQQAIANYVGTTGAGTNRYQVRNGLNHFLNTTKYKVYNVSSTMTTAQINTLWANIKGNLYHGGPSHTVAVNIVLERGGVRPPGYAPVTRTIDHWILVTGWWNKDGQNYVEIHDPASGMAGFSRNANYNLSLWSLTKMIKKTYVA